MAIDAVLNGGMEMRVARNRATRQTPDSFSHLRSTYSHDWIEQDRTAFTRLPNLPPAISPDEDNASASSEDFGKATPGMYQIQSMKLIPN